MKSILPLCRTLLPMNIKLIVRKGETRAYKSPSSRTSYEEKVRTAERSAVPSERPSGDKSPIHPAHDRTATETYREN